MRNLACAVLILLMGISASSAQTMDPAQAAAITGDKTGKYVAIETDHTFLMRKGWFAAMHCSSTDEEFIHLRIGEVHFRVPQNSLDSVLAAGLVMEESNGKYRVWHESDTGCPERPLVAAQADIAPPASLPADDLVLRVSSPNAAAFRATLLQLRDHPNDNCKAIKANAMVLCSGSFNNVMTSFLMVTEGSMLQDSGAPLHLRCTTIPTTSCGVEDDLSGNVSFQTAFPVDAVRDISPLGIRSFYQGARAAVDKLKAPN